MTCMEAQHTKHVTYKLAYHFVWCPKYRKHILTGKIAACVEQELCRICKANTWTIGALDVQEDHVHLFLSAPPAVAPSPTVQYTYERDYTFQRNQQVSIGTLNGRTTVPFQGYDEHIALIRHGASIGDARLWYDKARKTFYLLGSLEIDVPEPTCEQLNEVVGVDVGIRYLAVTSTSTGKTTFHPGRRVRHQANHYARRRKRLQKQGTRGAKRRLKRIEQRERRLKLQANHIVAKQIIVQHPHALIGLEQLTDIRERTRRRKRKRKKHGKGYERVSPKARKATRVHSQWSFAELHALIGYKAALSGSQAIKVDADYTSKGCPMCGYTADENRPEKGLLFICQNPNCHYMLHADLVGARNLVMRTLVLRQDWSTTGHLSIAPDASDNEAKAARLKRYGSRCGGVQVQASGLRPGIIDYLNLGR
jgi:putative transposase